MPPAHCPLPATHCSQCLLGTAPLPATHLLPPLPATHCPYAFYALTLACYALLICMLRTDHSACSSPPLFLQRTDPTACYATDPSACYALPPLPATLCPVCLLTSILAYVTLFIKCVPLSKIQSYRCYVRLYVCLLQPPPPFTSSFGRFFRYFFAHFSLTP